MEDDATLGLARGGLGANIRDNDELLSIGLILYDALHACCHSLSDQRHDWHPGTMLKEMRS